MNKNEPGIAIIILNWNSYNDTFECLNSLNKLTYKNFEVFLADNASKDNSFEDLKNDYVDNNFNFKVTFVQTGANLGFAGGNNIAIKKAYEQYNYFWMLNNDTIVEPKSLSYLVNNLISKDEIGIVGSKILYHNTDQIWFAGGEFNSYTGKTKHIGLKEANNQYSHIVKEVDYITGCSLLFKKEVIETIGLMQEDYFLYYEETDWNIRAKQYGWKINYVSASIIYHKISMASGGESNPAPYIAYYDIRNRLICIKRTQNKLKYYIGVIYTIGNALKKIAKVIIKKQDSKAIRLKYIIKGLIHAFSNTMGKIN